MLRYSGFTSAMTVSLENTKGYSNLYRASIVLLNFKNHSAFFSIMGSSIDTSSHFFVAS
jgi:hypothetical protein